jgi:sensor c-di-GMP phosphodiesterase-like protein
MKSHTIPDYLMVLIFLVVDFVVTAIVWNIFPVKGYPSFVVALLTGTGVALVVIARIPSEVSSSPSLDEYSMVIERISSIGEQLSGLNAFLEKERERVADIEATVRSLNDEKTRLEPVVSTQRETVEAILAAHSARTARQAWRERLFGFGLGLIASLVASFLYGYFRP